MKNSRKGFTLVELLIVIVVIGVLSTMMMLSSTEAVTSAKASNIVSNLRNMKTAALAWYADNLNSVTGTSFKLADQADNIKKYMSNEALPDGYGFVGSASDNSWYVFYNGTDISGSNSRVAEKLDAKKSAVGIYAEANTSSTSTIVSQKAAYMFIR